MHNFLSRVSRPARYLGQEYNSVQKDWEKTQVRFGLLFPDIYEIGMSHQGLQILYHILNNRENFLAERCFCPDTDAERILRESVTPLTSLESARPLLDFDILGFTLPYELCYSNILTILDLAGIPFYSRDREEQHPLIVAGGACALNPEPVADFFDAVLLGDGEEAILDIGAHMAHAKQKGLSRLEQLQELATIKGMYIPSHFQPVTDAQNTFQEIRHNAGVSKTISRRIVQNLDEIEHLKHPIVPNARIVHDRLGIEVARGCTRGCRFCQAGIIYRPVRERSTETIMALAESGLSDSGFEELALLSLSTGDYSCLDQALPALMNRFASEYVSVAMPSMRVGTLTPAIMEQVRRVRKTGFTLAPEAGSDRLRMVINKGITEEDLLATCRQAFELGWLKIKLYFMIGLPTETDEDIDAIANLVTKILKLEQGGKGSNRRQITVSVGTFIPKPHTPFQWDRQIGQNESQRIFEHLRRILPQRKCSFRYHSSKISYLEGVFSRGDRRLAELIVAAWKTGARLDGWDEHFNLERWQQAAQGLNLDLDQYLEIREPGTTLPWSHLRSGVDEDFLLQERNKALDGGIYTPDCRYHACQKCGLCDFKALAPIVHDRKRFEEEEQIPAAIPPGRKKPDPNLRFNYMVRYSRHGRIAFLGHLEILQLMFRILRRVEIPLHFSQGFNPSPKISFGPALPVGTESDAEFFLMDLYRPLKNLEEVTQSLNDSSVPGITFTAIEPHRGKMPQRLLNCYRVTLATPMDAEQQASVKTFQEAEKHTVLKLRKGKQKEIDIRPIVTVLRAIDLQTLHLELLTEAGKPAIKPSEAVADIIALNAAETLQLRIVKTAWNPLP